MTPEEEAAALADPELNPDAPAPTVPETSVTAVP
jgi:hypothetical protein